MPGGSKKGGGLTTKKSAFYKMKGNPMQRNFPGMTVADAVSPLEHTTNRAGHEKKYGKGHDNSAHPDYWKAKKTEHHEEGDVVRSDKEREIYSTHPGKWSVDDEGRKYTTDESGTRIYSESPTKHTTNRIGHEEKYGKKHDNSAHKDYWKKTKTRHEKYNPEKYPKATTSRKEREIELSNYIKKHGGIPSGLPTVR